tara:strand:+ start:117 stop:338 length:222 start_codon:yes stop_codon:yes gene_type:complete
MPKRPAEHAQQEEGPAAVAAGPAAAVVSTAVAAAPQGMSEAEVRAAAAAEVMSLLSAGRECATVQNTDRYREK